MEYWDIYDRNKMPTGRIMKKEDWNMKDDEYHLTVQGVLRRPDGRYLISQRIRTKSWAPLWWEVSGGGVQAGETSREAVNREVLEETGIDVSGLKEDFLYTYCRENHEEKNNYFVDTYLFTLDFDLKDVKMQEAEVEDCRLATFEEIKEIAASGKFMHFDSMRSVFEF